MYQDIIQKSTRYLPYVFLVLVFLIGLGLGLLINNGGSSQIIIDKNAKVGLPEASQNFAPSAVQNGSNFMASINGKAYYPKNCAAGNRIKEENRVWFATTEEAEAQGYKPAQNCAQ